MQKVRFGVIGTNFISDWVMAGAAEDSRFELTAVCSRSEATGRSFAERHAPDAKVFTSVDELAASDCVDAVYIAVPNFLHASYSIKCMSGGKHVLCEKPLASNAAEALTMIEASRRYGVALMEAMKPTMTPNFGVVKDNLGRLGKVRRYSATYCQYSSRYDRFKNGELPNAFNPAMSNGAIMDIGVYTIYPMVVLFGRPDKITASGLLLSSGADGQGSAMFSYDGMEANVMYSKIADSKLRSEIQGEEGLLSLDTINRMGDIRFSPRAANLGGGLTSGSTVENLSVTPSHNEYYYEIAEFITMIEEGRIESSTNSHLNSLITMEIIDEIRRQTEVVFPADRQ